METTKRVARIAARVLAGNIAVEGPVEVQDFNNGSIRYAAHIHRVARKVVGQTNMYVGYDDVFSASRYDLHIAQQIEARTYRTYGLYVMRDYKLEEVYEFEDAPPAVSARIEQLLMVHVPA